MDHHVYTTEQPVTRPAPLLANDMIVVYESPDPRRIYPYSPGLACAMEGRFIATFDFEGVTPAIMPGMKSEKGKHWIGQIYTSDDIGKTWQFSGDMPLMHARPFRAGNMLYIIGHYEDLGIMRSTDNGDTWEGPFWLTQGEHWHQAPCNVHYANGRVYLVMERNTDPEFNHWPVEVLAPVVMSGLETADLTARNNWTFSNALSYRKIIQESGVPNLLGIPFHTIGNTTPDNPDDTRPMSPVGWLETNIVQFRDPTHVWHDPEGKTFHLWMRAHTGSVNMAAIAKVKEDDSGKLTVQLEKAPSGVPILYVPCPGGQMKFHILYDEQSELFWLLSSQTTDSMTRPEFLPSDRYNLPNNERHRLVLHFSRNCVDWCFAGRITDSGQYGQSRNYASMVIQGENLYILSRSGNSKAKNAHDGNMITFHVVHNFRNLIY